jgi:hypothetical protein
MPRFIPFYDPNRHQMLRDAGREETLRIARMLGLELSDKLLDTLTMLSWMDDTKRPSLEGEFTVVDQKALPPPKPCTGVLPE